MRLVRFPLGAAVSPRSGALLMLAAMFLFTANDTVGKWLTSSYSVSQIMFFRGCIGLIVLAPLLNRANLSRIIYVDRPWLMLARAVATTVDAFAFYYAVTYMPLADVMTFFLAAPIYVTALAPFILGEKVGWRRWSAVGCGFLGVIVALEPSSAIFSLPAIAAVFGSFAYGLMLISARTLKGTPGLTLVFWQTCAAVIVGIAFAPATWEPTQMADLPYFLLFGVLGLGGHVFVNHAFKLADAAMLAPLQYTQLVWAIGFGWIIFGDLPSYQKLLGAALIVASGTYIFVRERAVPKRIVT